jgi:hypothetical protein
MKTIKLTHTKSQDIITKELGTIPQSDLSITVSYDPEERTVEEIISVCVFNWKTLETTDITHIMVEQFDQALENMIERIDWNEEYREIVISHATNPIV